MDNGWQEWGFEQFLEALTKWTKRSPKLFGAPEIILKRDNIIRLRTKKKNPVFVSIVIRKFTNIMLAIPSRKYLIGESSNINEVLRSILNFLFFSR